MLEGTLIIATALVVHWSMSIFVQSFYLHRYAAHRMFTMSPGWERFFHLVTWLAQGSSCLNARGYAILHREHHAYSDAEGDPHSPHHHSDVMRMMWATKVRYHGLVKRIMTPEARFEEGIPEWPLVDRISDSWVARIGLGTAWGIFYLAFAPHWAFLLLLPVHWLVGPIQGAIVNWCGHKYGYRNFEETGDRSKNTIPMDFVVGGELFQNNHHARPASPTFAYRWFEIDPVFLVMRVLHGVGIIRLAHPRYQQDGKTTGAPKRPRSPVPLGAAAK